jgi:hypothetical protein
MDPYGIPPSITNWTQIQDLINWQGINRARMHYGLPSTDKMFVFLGAPRESPTRRGSVIIMMNAEPVRDADGQVGRYVVQRTTNEFRKTFLSELDIQKMLGNKPLARNPLTLSLGFLGFGFC